MEQFLPEMRQRYASSVGKEDGDDDIVDGPARRCNGGDDKNTRLQRRRPDHGEDGERQQPRWQTGDEDTKTATHEHNEAPKTMRGEDSEDRKATTSTEQLHTRLILKPSRPGLISPDADGPPLLVAPASRPGASSPHRTGV